MREDMLRNEAMNCAGNMLAEEKIIREMEMSQDPGSTITTQVLTIICC